MESMAGVVHHKTKGLGGYALMLKFRKNHNAYFGTEVVGTEIGKVDDTRRLSIGFDNKS